MPVGFVARPSKTGKRKNDLPAIRDDLADWVPDLKAMIGVVE